MMTGGWVGEEGAGRSGKSRSGDGLMGQETLKSARDICTVRAATIRTQPSRCLRGELLSCEGRSEASEHASGGGKVQGTTKATCVNLCGTDPSSAARGHAWCTVGSVCGG
jgi:hypothetical protein